MTDQQNITAAGWFTLIALALIWGGSFLAFALGLREIPVFTLVAHRVFWGCLALWLVVLVLRIPIPKSVRLWSAMLVMGALNNVIPFSLIVWAQTHIESGLASILNGTTAFFGILLAALFFADERLTKNKLIGCILAFIGVCVIIGMDALRALNIRSLAQLALILSSFSYGCAAVWARRSFGRVNPIMAATGMLTGSTIIVLPLAYFIDGAPSFDLSISAWGAIAFLGLPCTAIAYLLYYRALRLTGSGNVSLVTLLIPPTAVFWGAAILGEKLPATAFIGFLLIAAGMVVLDGRLFGRFQKTD